MILSGVLSQKTITAYLKSKKLLSFDFAQYYAQPKQYEVSFPHTYTYSVIASVRDVALFDLTLGLWS